MGDSTQSSRTQSYCQLFWALIASAAFLSALCIFFTPQWETNDDVGMSMVAHGYGLAATSSPNLIFSNVIWGRLVRSIPQINGLLGYSIATFGVLVIFGTVMLYTLRKLGLGWLGSIAALTLVLVRPILFPQFTINAGLMTVGAIFCWHLYGKQGDRYVFLGGCLLFFGSYLVRSQECLLLMLIALPLLPWAKLIRDRLVSQSGVPIVANDWRFDQLTKYCSEHLNGSLQKIAKNDFGRIDVSWCRCLSEPE